MAPKTDVARSAFHALDGFKITSPALVALIGYAILMVLVLLPFNMYRYDDRRRDYVRTRYSFGNRLLILLLLLVPYMLSIYTVNCMVVGNCVAWSWIVAVLTLLWSIVVCVLTFMSGAFTPDMLV